MTHGGSPQSFDTSTRRAIVGQNRQNPSPSLPHQPWPDSNQTQQLPGFPEKPTWKPTKRDFATSRLPPVRGKRLRIHPGHGGEACGEVGLGEDLLDLLASDQTGDRGIGREVDRKVATKTGISSIPKTEIERHARTY